MIAERLLGCIGITRFLQNLEVSRGFCSLAVRALTAHNRCQKLDFGDARFSVLWRRYAGPGGLMASDHNLHERASSASTDYHYDWIAHLAWAGLVLHALAILVLIGYSLYVFQASVENGASDLVWGFKPAAVAILFFVLCFLGFLLYVISGYSANALLRNYISKEIPRHESIRSTLSERNLMRRYLNLKTITLELAEQFRFVASAGATSSLLILMGVFVSAFQYYVFQVICFSVAALPLVALSLKPFREVFHLENAATLSEDAERSDEKPK
jgi:hypothetical protein